MLAFLLLFSVVSIWLAVIETLFIIAGSLRFHFKKLKESVEFKDIDWEHLPTVTVMVPAHNEERVIEATVRRILAMNYPHEKMEIRIINDRSQDNTKQIVKRIIKMYEKRDIQLINTADCEDAGGGKSQALNYGRQNARGEFLCVYDADAAPEQNALLLLVRKVLENEEYGAVFGRNKARNRNRNMLTRMINLELITSQRVVHTGRWQFFRLGQIPGTNFIVRRSIIDEIGGWDVDALTEDTELGFEIMARGYRIALESRAEAYQQEPEQLSVYIKQRTRWAKGNLYVVLKNVKRMFGRNDWRIKLETFYYLSTYFWFLVAVMISNTLFIIGLIFNLFNLFGFDFVLPIELSKPMYIVFVISWGLMYTLYVLQIFLALVTDRGQSTVRNFLLACVSYFTYAQLFIIISIQAYGSYFLDFVLKRQRKWYKTERY
ncbi:glycosyltransferase [Culicoidibacter larvae]|uniref:Glycosyltransferase family 2 protein n=1 Tax=Culicoidibacter larvae TaxID=2579976 RepID=A0A5R8QAA6_9FIRM|nr:glycosyltransferase family 2 protein [Culicoidibacter larvae]